MLRLLLGLLRVLLRGLLRVLLRLRLGLLLLSLLLLSLLLAALGSAHRGQQGRAMAWVGLDVSAALALSCSSQCSHGVQVAPVQAGRDAVPQRS